MGTIFAVGLFFAIGVAIGTKYHQEINNFIINYIWR